MPRDANCRAPTASSAAFVRSRRRCTARAGARAVGVVQALACRVVSRRNHTRVSVLERRYTGGRRCRVDLDGHVNDVEARSAAAPCSARAAAATASRHVSAAEYRFRPMHQTCRSTTRLPSTRSTPPRTACADLRSRAAIEQHGARRLEQAEGPARNEHGAYEAHERIHPAEPEILRGQQRDDREHRRQRVGEHVQIGRHEVVIVPCCRGRAWSWSWS